MEKQRAQKHSAVIARNAVTKQSRATHRGTSGLLRRFAARNDAFLCATPAPFSVTPAKAGTQHRRAPHNSPWIPAYAGMTDDPLPLSLTSVSSVVKQHFLEF